MKRRVFSLVGAVLLVLALCWQAGPRAVASAAGEQLTFLPIVHKGFPDSCASGSFLASYFNNPALSGSPVAVQCESAIDYRWGDGSPLPDVNPDNFSVRWSGTFTFAAGVYTFDATVSDGVRIWLDDTLILDEWRDQDETQFQTTVTVAAGEHEVRVEYYEGVGRAIAQLSWQGSECPMGQYRAEYFANPTLAGEPVLIRCEEAIDYRWGAGSPAAGVPADNFSVRWSGTFTFAAELYTFSATTDDGIRLWVDDALLLDEWRNQSESEYSATQSLSEGEHDIRVEYYDGVGDAIAQLSWSAPSCPVGQFHAEYYNNRTLSGTPLFTRCESAVDNAWGALGPGNGIPNDNFSVRWSGDFYFAANNYAFTALTDDGMRLWFDGTLILDEWREQAATSYTVTRSVTEGDHQLRIEYYEGTGLATADVAWGATCTVGQFRADYFNNKTLSSNPTFSRCESAVNQPWGTGGPGHGVGSDNFSVRWSGQFSFDGGTYSFNATTDDGMRIWVGGGLILDQWRDQSQTSYQTVTSVGAGQREVRVEYYDAGDNAIAQLTWARTCPTGQFYGQYYNNATLIGSPAFVRCDGVLDFNWGNGGPGSGVGSDNFSARWVGRFSFSAGSYRFHARTDDGIRIWLDGALILDEWRIQAVREFDVTRSLSAGEHEVRVEYFESSGMAEAELTWTRQ